MLPIHKTTRFKRSISAPGSGRARLLQMAAIAAVLFSSPADAARPDVRTMSCGQAQSLVQSRGAVVLSTGQHTYDRFVATAQFCSSDQVLERTWVTTQGGARCSVGYICRPRFKVFGY